MNFDNPDQWLDEHLCVKAMTLGLSMRHTHPEVGIFYRNMPITIQSIGVKESTYQMLIDIQPALNRLLVNIARDLRFLESTLVNCDEFSAQLLALHKQLLGEKPYGIASKAELGVFRMDYIVVDNGKQAKQVEMNTIAAGLAGVMPQVEQFHKYTAQCSGRTNIRTPEMDRHLPMPEALARAHNFYLSTLSSYTNGSGTATSVGDSQANEPQPRRTGILFVVEDFVVNIFDHKTIELNSSLDNQIPVYRRVFRTLAQSLRLGPKRELLLQLDSSPSSEVEITVVYFRTTYDPKDFNFDGSWQIRAMIERSLAIKCPSLALQIAGMKVFQTVLSQRDTLCHFLDPLDHPKVDAILSTFVKFYPVSGETSRMVQRRGAHNYVLKPNREGGGHNYFGDDIVPKIAEIIDAHQEEQYALMDFIHQAPQVGYVIGQRNRPLEWQKKTDNNLLNSELGIFGSILVCARTGRELFSAPSHYLLRVKPVGVNELGLMSGQGAVSSVNLID